MKNSVSTVSVGASIGSMRPNAAGSSISIESTSAGYVTPSAGAVPAAAAAAEGRGGRKLELAPCMHT